jgi:outer membrane lipopolysaccharide assembly protein LptE/RlpB
MTKKIISGILFLILLNNCGFSPIYSGDIKKILISKSEIVGDKNLAFDLEQKLNFSKDEKNLNAYIFKAQIYDAIENSLLDSRGIATEESLRLTISYQFIDKNGTLIYQDVIKKDKRITLSDNLVNNTLIKNQEKKIMLDAMVQNILFKSKISLR